VVTEAAVKQHLLRLYVKFRIAEGVNRRARLANEVISSGIVRPLPGRRRGQHPAGGIAASPWPEGFFDRADPSPDAEFYSAPRLVTHLDDRAIAGVSAPLRRASPSTATCWT
jgi:hypothetical protein